MIVVIISSFAVTDSEAAVGCSNFTQYDAGLISESSRVSLNSLTSEVLVQNLEETNRETKNGLNLNSGPSEKTHFMIFNRNENTQLNHIKVASENGDSDNGDEEENEGEEKEEESEGFDRLWDVSNLA